MVHPIFSALTCAALVASPFAHAAEAYPVSRTPSAGGKTYFVDPAGGDDAASGATVGAAKKTFAGVNALKLAPGDTVIVAPGTHVSSLLIEGEGTATNPIVVKFLPGRHLFAHGALFTEKLHISNTNDRPYEPKAVALLVRGAKFVRFEGPGATILAEGKMLYAHLDHAEGVSLKGLTFDYLHPTMGEYTVVKNGDGFSEVKTGRDNLYRIDKGRMYWRGAGWEFPLGSFQCVCNPKTATLRRGGVRGDFKSVDEISPGLLRLHFAKGNLNLEPGTVVQNRDTTRDCCGFFQAYSKDIVWNDCAIRYIHGMGVVSQFSENIRYENVRAEPAPGSDRTSVAWADVLHFSGCRGDIVVKNCILGYSHDDSINVHGTHLRITGTPAPDRLALRFMHPQSYGFEACFAGDELDFVRHDTLRPFGSAKVKSVRRIDDKNLEVTLDGPAPKDIHTNDVVENATWTPSLTVSDTTVRLESTRAFLITTRRPVVIERCRFEKTGMAAIWVEGDASSWFESGFVRDLTIRDNTFVSCAEPVVDVQPHTLKNDGPVHTGIVVTGNRFELSGGGLAVRARNAEVKVGANTYLKDGKPVPPEKAVQVK